MYALGIDTSNYKTSVAIVGPGGEIICNVREFLSVKKGEKGLRQSYALFQHINKLPEIIENVMDIARKKGCTIGCVAVSNRPRPVEDSYMPVFNAGISAGKIIAASLGVDYFEFSHQEGHLEAVTRGLPVYNKEKYIAFHFSGGTTEALLWDRGSISIIGGTLDIAFGQVLDRIGVAMGLDFPCGQAMDQMAAEVTNSFDNLMPQIKVKNGYMNLSGMETKGIRTVGTVDDRLLSAMVLQRIGQAIENTVKQMSAKYEIADFVFAGGVSASSYIRAYLQGRLDQNIYFGAPELSSDNAVGTALLGGKRLWH